MLYVVKDGDLFHYSYMGVEKLIIPPLMFLGVGAATNFGPMSPMAYMGSSRFASIFSFLAIGMTAHGYPASELGAIAWAMMGFARLFLVDLSCS